MFSFCSTDKKKEVLTKYTELCDKTKYLNKTIIGDEAGECKKDFMKIRFQSNDDLPLNKTLKLYMLTVVVRSVSEEDRKFYQQFFKKNACIGYKDATQYKANKH